MEPRFAALPKCASRSLAAAGLLGEVDGQPHSKITDYPDWEKYEWFMVDRPSQDWLMSWWAECQRTNNLLAHWAGFEYMDMWADLRKLHAMTGEAPIRPGLNGWVPPDFVPRLAESGKTLKEFCFAEIMDGVECTVIQLSELDQWLAKRGYFPHHKNTRNGPRDPYNPYNSERESDA